MDNNYKSIVCKLEGDLSLSLNLYFDTFQDVKLIIR